MPSKIKHLRSESHASIGEVIERHTAELIERWAERAKEEQPHAARVHHHVLLDHMAGLLAQLGRSLRTAGDESNEFQRQASEHGDQRWDTGWSVTEVVRDYQILRIVLCESLEAWLARSFEPREVLVMNAAIDDAIAASVAAFVASQAVPGTGTNTNKNDALELLLNVLGTVGHELRNPLAPLANSLEILRLVGSDPTRIESTRHVMNRQLRVLTRLVDDLMDLPRLARGKMSLRRECLDLAHLVRTSAEDRRKSAESLGLKLTVEVPAVPVWILGDETRLIQVVGNLIGNALKFTDRGGAVAIRLSRNETKEGVLTVADTGVGIDLAVLPKVFEAYVQADQSLDRSRGGLGLGLALVKGVVELHGGTITAASSGLGCGATFTIRLPILADSELPDHGDQESQTVAPHSRKVLIIEDNRDSAESLKMCLELQGHMVQTADSGPSGLEQAKLSSPEIVICDVGLPGMDGYAVASELRRSESPPHLILAVTGHGARINSEGEPDHVFDHYFLKPVEPDRIVKLLSADLPAPTLRGL